ncbi:hypothetical protein M501DRAFT_988488 [Patellaria atrata CBS 101060]|uniref:Uncharacterized protein n=1 Tax=Patellaria atrata CBS 101060 TaxID=1346257 RepID=A0A9P4SG17_9PEZI|nr:hypothetical protein M501DRAFT_988488 [Patellaria atrata CBS 101060]
MSFMGLPLEMRDHIYMYFIPHDHVRVHLPSPLWNVVEENDMESCDASTAVSTRTSDRTSESISDPLSDSSSSMATLGRAGDEEVESLEYVDDPADPEWKPNSDRNDMGIPQEILDEYDDEIQLRKGRLALMLSCKQLQAEFLDTIVRNTNKVLYIYIENTPDQPYDFVFDESFWKLEGRKLVISLVIVARWHAGWGWDCLQDGGKEVIDLTMDDDSEVEDASANVAHSELTAFDRRRLKYTPNWGMWNTVSIHPTTQTQLDSTWNMNGNFDQSYRTTSRFLDAKDTDVKLYNTVERFLERLPNVKTLDLGLELVGVNSNELSKVDDKRQFNIDRFFVYHPPKKNKVRHVIKTLRGGDWKHIPSRVEEWLVDKSILRANKVWWNQITDEGPCLPQEQCWSHDPGDDQLLCWCSEKISKISSFIHWPTIWKDEDESDD